MPGPCRGLAAHLADVIVDMIPAHDVVAFAASGYLVVVAARIAQGVVHGCVLG